MRQGACVCKNRTEQTPPVSADWCMHTHGWVRECLGACAHPDSSWGQEKRTSLNCLNEMTLSSFDTSVTYIKQGRYWQRYFFTSISISAKAYTTVKRSIRKMLFFFFFSFHSCTCVCFQVQLHSMLERNKFNAGKCNKLKKYIQTLEVM